MQTQPTASHCGSTGRSEMPLRLSDFHFELPAELIAQSPAPQRDAARLLILDRQSSRRSHGHIFDLPNLLRSGDLLVVNDTRVIPARLHTRTDQGAAVELLFVRPANAISSLVTSGWVCLARPARRLRPGTWLRLPDGITAMVERSIAPGEYIIQLPSGVDVIRFLERHGEVPLPPYIKRPDGVLSQDAGRYQTVFAATAGAVAAPTAGLHFTQELLERLRSAGVNIAPLTLHVGPGTFLPIRTDDVREHRMEGEWGHIPESTAAAIRETKGRGDRVIAVGTTTTRALESAALSEPGVPCSGALWAQRFIVPGYEFQIVDALLTNFHLPGSTLLLLVAAIVGREHLLAAYHDAIAAGYRFYSYGDAMLIQ